MNPAEPRVNRAQNWRCPDPSGLTNWAKLDPSGSQTNPALAQITSFRCTCSRSGGIGNWFPCLLQYTFYSLGLPWAERHFGTFRHENIWKHVKYVETCENTQRRMKTRKHIQTHEKACENIFERMKRLVKTWKHVDTSLCELPVMATSYKKLLSHCSAL